MSTRAIIRIESEEEKSQSIYCHGDGYPEFLGRFLVGIVARLPLMDVNHPSNKPGGIHHRKRDWDRSMFLFVPNAAYEPEKIACAVIGELWRAEYTGTYLTDRVPEEEFEKDWTDIEHIYIIKAPKLYTEGVPELIWKEVENKQIVEHSQEELIEAIREGMKRWGRK